MSYCPKCGHKVDETMVFCPNCGFSLKTGAYQATPGPTAYQRPKNEKREKQEKGEKHEKTPQSRFSALMVAGVLVLFFGVIAVTDTLYHWVPSGPLAGAFWLLAIGVIIVAVGIYYATRARKHFPNTAA